MSLLIMISTAGFAKHSLSKGNVKLFSLPSEVVINKGTASGVLNLQSTQVGD